MRAVNPFRADRKDAEAVFSGVELDGRAGRLAVRGARKKFAHFLDFG
jgi:hypothetical protein